MPNTNTAKAAYQSGLDGLPEPECVTNHVRQINPLSGLWEEGNVETLASMARRHAWQKGNKQRELRAWLAERQKTEAA